MVGEYGPWSTPKTIICMCFLFFPPSKVQQQFWYIKWSCYNSYQSISFWTWRQKFLGHNLNLPAHQGFRAGPLTLSQTSPCFYVSAVQVFLKLCGKRRNCSLWAISPFPTVFSNDFGEFSGIYMNAKIVELSQFEMSPKFVLWERVNLWDAFLQAFKKPSTTILDSWWILTIFN